MYLNPLNFYYKPESPAMGLQSSPTACTASLIFASSKVPLPWHLPWIGSRSYQHAQYTCSTTSVPNHVSDCSITRYWNMAIWISWNIDIRGTLNCRDSFRRRKFENQALRSCRPGAILSITTNHQFWAPRENGRGDRPRNVQLWAIFGSSYALWPWPWPWIGSRSHQRTQYV